MAGNCAWTRPPLFPPSPTLVSPPDSRPLDSTYYPLARPGCRQVYLAEAGVGTLVPSKIIVRQLFDRESCTYSYLLVDSLSSEAILIDPVLELADRDAEVMRRMGVRLTQILNTHVHADHVTGSGKLRAMVAQSG